MLMIRLQRVGRRHDPSYKIVVTEKTAGPRAGRFVEVLGHYDARVDKGAGKDLQIKAERVKYWISVGAQTSGTLHNLLVREEIVAGKKRDVRPSKKIKTKQTTQIMTKIEQAPNEEVKPEEISEEVKAEEALPV